MFLLFRATHSTFAVLIPPSNSCWESPCLPIYLLLVQAITSYPLSDLDISHTSMPQGRISKVKISAHSQNPCLDELLTAISDLDILHSCCPCQKDTKILIRAVAPYCHDRSGHFIQLLSMTQGFVMTLSKGHTCISMMPET